MREQELQELARRLSDPSDAIRIKASGEILELGVDAAGAMPHLIHASNDSVVRVARNSILTLQKIGPAAKPAIPALVNLLKDDAKAKLLGSEISKALISIGPDVVKPLLECLNESLGENTKSTAASTLCGFGESANVIVPALIELLDSGRSDFVLSIQSSISVMGISALPYLERVISQQSHPLRYRAALIILHIDPKHIDSIMTIEVGMNSTEPSQRSIAAECLVDAHPDVVQKCYPPVKRISILSRMMEDAHDDVRLYAAMYVCNGDLAMLSIYDARVFIGMLDDNQSFVRIAGARCLGTIRANRPEAIASLILKLNDVDEDVRLEAAIALGKIGAPAASAIQHLKDVLPTIKDPGIRDQFQRIIEMMSSAE